MGIDAHENSLPDDASSPLRDGRRPARRGDTRLRPEASSEPKLENRTLWQRVHDHLRTEIRAGRLVPGAELNEVALSQELGVSRGPIREALGRLAAEGLVTIRPRRGAVVRALSGDEFAEAYQVREALEVMAVRLAVPRLAPPDLERLAALTDEMRTCAEADDVAGFFEANRAFHLVFFEAAGNRMLSDLYHQVCGQIDRYRLRSLELRGNLHRSIAEHRAILRAAKSGDAERTARLVGEHIRVPMHGGNPVSPVDPLASYTRVPRGGFTEQSPAKPMERLL